MKYPEEKAYFVLSNKPHAFALRTWLKTPFHHLEKHILGVVVSEGGCGRYL